MLNRAESHLLRNWRGVLLTALAVFVLWVQAAPSPVLAQTPWYNGTDGEMILLRELMRLSDQQQGRVETDYEKEIESKYTLDVYGCIDKWEPRILAEVMQSFSPDIGDSIIAVLFVEEAEFLKHTSQSAVAFAHYSNMVAVRKTCGQVVESFDLRRMLVHEIAHIRTFNVYNFEQLFPREDWGRRDMRTLQEKWTTIPECSAYVGASWASLSSPPAGFVSTYAASSWIEDIAEMVAVHQLPAYHKSLDHLALRKLYVAYHRQSGSHQACLEEKFRIINQYRFIDDETAALVRDVWASSEPESEAFKARSQANREVIWARNLAALAER